MIVKGLRSPLYYIIWYKDTDIGTCSMEKAAVPGANKLE